MFTMILMISMDNRRIFYEQIGVGLKYLFLKIRVQNISCKLIYHILCVVRSQYIELSLNYPVKRCQVLLKLTNNLIRVK